MDKIKLQFGNVQNKNIFTKNDFISHMLEQMAWRLGASITVIWNNEDWFLLGKSFGKEIKKIQSKQKSGVALGLIDDGCAEIKIELRKTNLNIKSVKNLDLKWFLAQRCEQLSSGKPLIELLKGLTKGLEVNIEICICNFEDPHHTWESIFRGVGTALSKIFTPENKIQKIDSSLDYALRSRKTAETEISVGVDLSKTRSNSFSIKVNNSININGIERLFENMATGGNFTLQINFNATALSSSHVVMEDIGIVLGQALLQILKNRMETIGINGAGSSLQTIADLKREVRVGVSVEGRKFWRFVPFSMTYQELQKKFFMGQNIYQNLRSEDLDDFIDGLAGGLSASIVINIEKFTEAEKTWVEIFKSLGTALGEVFTYNPYRKGVPPGVKATLN